MARPRVFVSSTFYDLKYVRASLEAFIESLGYDAVLFERGDVPFAHDAEIDKSCYTEVENSDILVLIVGGRYGSKSSIVREGGSSDGDADVPDNYESVTKTEYSTAIENDIPVYIFIESSVYAEYFTYLNNKNTKGIVYAHAKSPAVFRFIEGILNQRRNNPVQGFDRPGEIASYLREQWAGRFRELLRQKTQQRQIDSLSSQVHQLSILNNTLNSYLEQIITRLTGEESVEIIKKERDRLAQALALAEINEEPFVKYLHVCGVQDTQKIVSAVKDAADATQLRKNIEHLLPANTSHTRGLLDDDTILYAANSLRRRLGLHAIYENAINGAQHDKAGSPPMRFRAKNVRSD